MFLTNAARAKVWDAAYEPFGRARVFTSTVEMNLRLPGQQLHAETGLHQNWMRDYDPMVGRYLQPDPIGLEGGPNVYGYVGGDPLNYVDPDGQIPQAILVPILVGATVAAGIEIADQVNSYGRVCSINAVIAQGAAGGVTGAFGGVVGSAGLRFGQAVFATSIFGTPVNLIGAIAANEFRGEPTSRGDIAGSVVGSVAGATAGEAISRGGSLVGRQLQALGRPAFGTAASRLGSSVAPVIDGAVSSGVSGRVEQGVDGPKTR